MERIPIFNAKTKLSELGRLAKEAGRRFIVTNRGEDMFEIGPVSKPQPARSKREAMEAIKAATAGSPRQSVEQTRADIEYGRE